ncbi:hypothetical protein [Rathayibacter toxicus]|uniref:Uncharacterized protein n=1 Tax=Rathayibacter toxicus TaxID=145458 RepID=A0A0C5BDN0_9MICO|nr:hypothetical protein [Rathayibacter toxicus]AJM77029.1 hypothetical protein TI83_01700 [Rathayibacter toxicus]ALS57167.1 hypothetical protein APU90_04790 [Rathayibacter toxicus]KKM46028.1 hypothetical protein VT73_02715 [Rathayibacter toxicus]PPG22959.1 hypothetical protein C5D15_01480 [Rathayibacter toxicus]PPG47540.1 hypothetical protein C5D16_01470 [Rathayibacter toxicus]
MTKEERHDARVATHGPIVTTGLGLIGGVLLAQQEPFFLQSKVTLGFAEVILALFLFVDASKCAAVSKRAVAPILRRQGPSYDDSVTSAKRP